MSNTKQYDEQKIWKFLSEIPDPEIPVISITELGVLRKVEIENDIEPIKNEATSDIPLVITKEEVKEKKKEERVSERERKQDKGENNKKKRSKWNSFK